VTRRWTNSHPAVRAAGSRGDVWLVAPTGAEMRKVRPAVVVSPDELNAHLRTFILAPLTTGGHAYPYRVVDGALLVRRLGRLSPATLSQALATLQAMFAH